MSPSGRGAPPRSMVRLGEQEVAYSLAGGGDGDGRGLVVGNLFATHFNVEEAGVVLGFACGERYCGEQKHTAQKRVNFLHIMI